MVALVLLAGLSGGVSLRALMHLEQMMRTIATEAMESTQGGLELENALLEQQGLVSRAVASGAAASLEELAWRSRRWPQVFDAVSRRADQPDDQLILGRLTVAYQTLQAARERAIGHIRSGDLRGARQVLDEAIDPASREAHALCEQYVLLQRAKVTRALADAQQHVVQTSILVYGGIVLSFAFGVALLMILLREIFRPLEAVATEASQMAPAPNGAQPDGFAELSDSLRLLVRNAKEARASLASSEGKLQQAEATGKLAACVAHEVRSPLQTMSIALHSFQKQVGSDPELLDRCRMFREEIDRLERIVHHFLAFAKPPHLHAGGVSIDDVIARTLRLQGDQLERAGIRVVYESERPVPPVRGDAEQLRQVFQNLVCNSILAMPGGGTLHLQRDLVRDGGQSWLSVRIRDCGVGIPAQVQSRLFEPFVTSREEGTGLGLAIASSIVSRHGGRLSLDSTSDDGTTFLMMLPALAD